MIAKHVLEWNYQVQIRSKILQFLQLQQQAGSISTTNSLSYQNPESPSHVPVFFNRSIQRTQTVKLTVITTLMRDEDFFVEEIRKYPCIWDTKCRDTVVAPKSRMLHHSCADYLRQKVVCNVIMQIEKYCCISINDKLRGYSPSILFHIKNARTICQIGLLAY